VFLLFSFAAGSALADLCEAVYCLDAKVVGITDRDTVTVLGTFAGAEGQKRLRLTDIDSPERGQPWSAKSRQALADKVFQQQVRIADHGQDRYGRLLGRIYLGERDINREMVREGHAWVYRQYSSDIVLLEDEDLARGEKAGLWSLPEAERIPPWERRRGDRRPATASLSGTSAEATFQCGAKTSCREMVNCEEARFFLESCGLSRLDSNNDGTPCERICGN